MQHLQQMQSTANSLTITTIAINERISNILKGMSKNDIFSKIYVTRQLDALATLIEKQASLLQVLADASVNSTKEIEEYLNEN